MASDLRDTAAALRGWLRGTAYGRPLHRALGAVARRLRRARGAMEDAYVAARFRRGEWQAIRWGDLVITETRHDPYVAMIALGRTAQLHREDDAARRLLRDPAPVIFDVGANVGVVSLLLSAAPGATVYAFEPVRFLFEVLQRNLQDNRRTNVVAVNEGMSDTAGTRFIGTPAAAQHPRYRRPDARKTGLYSVHATPAAAGEARFGETARFTTLDAFCAARGIDRLSYLKIDVEGHEAAVLHGGRGVLSGLRPVCQLELNAFTLAIANTAAAEILGMLEALRYAVFVFDGRRFTHAPVDALAAAPGLQEIYAVPREAVSPAWPS